jgi:hypothetical protein
MGRPNGAYRHLVKSDGADRYFAHLTHPCLYGTEQCPDLAMRGADLEFSPGHLLFMWGDLIFWGLLVIHIRFVYAIRWTIDDGDGFVGITRYLDV